MRKLTVTDSSNVVEIAWNEDSTMDVNFNSGAKYRYQNVQLHQFGEVAMAASIGRWVNATLVRHKDRYPVTRLTEKQELTVESVNLEGETQLWASHAGELIRYVGDREWVEVLDVLARMVKQATIEIRDSLRAR